jgi:Outer membrane protein beta-barrel domain
MKLRSILVAFALLLGASATASAQEEPKLKLLSPFGESIQVGGGVTNFLADATRDATNVGGYWDVRATFGTRSYLGGEAAYLGAAQNVRALGLDSNAYLTQNGIEGAVRVNLPIEKGRFLLEPFALGGVGWAHYDIQNASVNTSSMKGSDDVLTLPVGCGLALGYEHLIIDGRFTYRPAFNDELMTAGNSAAGLQNWSAGAMVGYEY